MARKTLKPKTKQQNVYISTLLIKIVDTLEKDINKEISKHIKREVKRPVASEIIAKILIKNSEGLIKRNTDLLKPYYSRKR